MNTNFTIDKDEPIFSPLHLLYTAYTDQRPVINQVITESFPILEQYLAPLSHQTQHLILQTFRQIYSERERLAFLTGIHVGVRLERELENI